MRIRFYLIILVSSLTISAPAMAQKASKAEKISPSKTEEQAKVETNDEKKIEKGRRKRAKNAQKVQDKTAKDVSAPKYNWLSRKKKKSKKEQPSPIS